MAIISRIFSLIPATHVAGLVLVSPRLPYHLLYRSRIFNNFETI